MEHYPTIIEWSDDDQAYVATVPDLPGCFADGRTRAEAAQHADEIISHWLEVAREEGRPIPAPTVGLAVQRPS